MNTTVPLVSKQKMTVNLTGFNVKSAFTLSCRQMLCIKIRHIFRQLFPICYLCFAALKLRLLMQILAFMILSILSHQIKTDSVSVAGGLCPSPPAESPPSGLAQALLCRRTWGGLFSFPRCSWMLGPALPPRRAAAIPVWQGKSVCATQQPG